MFWHIFRYNLKSDLRDRALVFWTLAFPLILATLFGMAFANLGQTEGFQPDPGRSGRQRRLAAGQPAAQRHAAGSRAATVPSSICAS